MNRVLAQGTFDLLHPGHIHYLEESAKYGNELHVIIARRENVTHKQQPILSNQQRRDMVAALEIVDSARIGHSSDFFIPVQDIDPDVIVLGHDQHHDEHQLRKALQANGIDCDVVRASAREPSHDGELLSTGRIIARICDLRC